MATDSSSGHHHAHPVRDALTAAGDASAEFLATMFADTHHESWEDAVRRYDDTHPTPPPRDPQA
jgi:hypothetical protein